MLTVFIATRDGAATLPRTLSAYTRVLPPQGGWKLVLVDNGSADDSARIARSFAGRLPLSLLAEPRRGKNRALNSGLGALEGDLAVFSDDDTVPAPDWLVRLRAAADCHREYAVFGGRILPLWDVPPAQWILQWVRTAPVFALTESALEEGPCDATKVWGPNMAIRASWFRNGYRFDERIGPNGSATYAMGGETELTLRMAIAERAACWHCRDAQVRHIITARQMTRQWILKRAFRLGRCVRRESEQNAGAGRPHIRRDAATICGSLVQELINLGSAFGSADARRMFEARWQINFWRGCLYEALAGRHGTFGPILDVVPQR